MAKAYGKLAPGRLWKLVGYGSSLVAYVIFCYYTILVGWVLFYLWESVTGGFSDLLERSATAGDGVYKQFFNDFVKSPFKPLIFLALTMLSIFGIIVAGVKKGIERTSKFLVPALLVIMLILAGFALFMPGAADGYRFLFDFRVDAITTDVCLAALGQCFYSFSIGMGLVTYASYFTDDTNLAKTAVSVGFLDTAVAILAGLIIFPAVFSVAGTEPGAGASMVFVTLPAAFNSAFSSQPALACAVPFAFYFILFVAALTSAMFLFEVATAFLCEAAGMKRSRSAAIIAVSSLVIAVVTSLSVGPWDFIRIMGMNLMDFLDAFTAKIVLPLTGLGAALFVGWRMGREDVMDELSSHGRFAVICAGPFLFTVRYLVPVLILAIMADNFISLLK